MYSSLPSPLYFLFNRPPSYIVLLSSHHIPMPLQVQPPFLGFLCDLSNLQTFLCRYGADAGELTDNVLASLGNLAAVWHNTSVLAAQTITIKLAGELCDEVARKDSNDSVASRENDSKKGTAAKVTAWPTKNDTAMKATQCSDPDGHGKNHDTAMKATQCNEADGRGQDEPGPSGETSKQSPKQINSSGCCCCC